MNESMATVFGLLGGLALFIFGMNMMSESLQKVAGDKMKKVLGVLTRNAVCGMLAGALVTAVLQSSSATTVLVIGFVSAGLMSLKQGISVIFGANIGTTMTAQLMAFKISDYIMPIVFIGFLIAFIAKKEKVCRTDNLRFRFVVCWYRDDGRCHEAACNKPGIYQYDGESQPYSGTWRWCRFGYDACRTEQLRNDCGIAELRITGRSGWCECDRISWRNSDSARR